MTDPEKPIQNRIEIGRAAFTLDGLLLLRRKFIINEMAAEGVRLDVPRKSPGRVIVAPKQTAPPKGASFTLPSMDLPNAATLLEKERLHSPAIIDKSRADLAGTRAAWQKRMAELPDTDKIAGYRDRLKALQSTRGKLPEIAQAASDLRGLRRDIDQDILRVREAKRALTSDLAAAQGTVDEAIRAPQEDLSRISAKYGLSTAGLSNLSRSLFGSTISSRVSSALLWYHRLRPLVTRASAMIPQGSPSVVKPIRAKGVDVRFQEYAPRPDLLISLVKASFKPATGTLAGTIRNITPNQDVLGAPLSFAFSGSDLPSVARLQLDGTLDHVHPKKPLDSLRFRATGYRISGLALMTNADLPVTLKTALVDLDLTGHFDGKAISAQLSSTLRDASFDAGGSGALADGLRTALSKVSRFTLTADVTGEPDNYVVNLSSDLDRVLKDAVGTVIGQKAALFEKDLRSAIQSRTGDALKSLQTELADIRNMGSNIDSLEKQLSNLLKDATQAGGTKLKLPF